MVKYASWDGALVPEEEVLISPFSATATYGLNVFEGLRAYWNETDGRHTVLFLQEHLRRLRESAQVLSIRHPFNERAMKDALCSLLNTAPEGDLAVRMSLMVVGDLGESWSSDCSANLAIRYFPSSSMLGQRRYRSAFTTSWRRPSNAAIPMSVKCGANYVNSRYGQLQATSMGMDLPIFLDENGFAVEGGGANLMIRKGDEITVCAPEQPILRGITQDYVCKHIDRKVYTVTVRPITLPDLYTADEVLLLGTTAELTDVTTIDGRNIGGPGDCRMFDHATRILLDAIQEERGQSALNDVG